MHEKAVQRLICAEAALMGKSARATQSDLDCSSPRSKVYRSQSSHGCCSQRSQVISAAWHTLQISSDIQVASFAITPGATGPSALKCKCIGLQIPGVQPHLAYVLRFLFLALLGPCFTELLPDQARRSAPAFCKIAACCTCEWICNSASDIS